LVEDELSVLAERLADELHAALWVRRYGDHVERMRSFKRPSEKLIYLFLLKSEPQSFITIYQALSLSTRTVDRALKQLLARGYVVLDDSYLYWVAPL
jgi:DNA-binding MarR family transcriptional regulator